MFVTGEFTLVNEENEIIEQFSMKEDGTVKGTSALGYECKGTYVFTNKGLVKVTYDGPYGSGSVGGCHNASFSIEFNTPGIAALDVGDTTSVVSRSSLDYGAPHQYILKRIR